MKYKMTRFAQCKPIPILIRASTSTAQNMVEFFSREPARLTMWVQVHIKRTGFAPSIRLSFFLVVGHCPLPASSCSKVFLNIILAASWYMTTPSGFINPGEAIDPVLFNSVIVLFIKLVSNIPRYNTGTTLQHFGHIGVELS